MERNLHPRANLDLIPLGILDFLSISIVGAHIQSVLGLLTNIQQARVIPDFAFMPVRNQYDATKIIKALASEPEGASLKLGMTQEDLTIPILTYVYGESQLGGKAAVISLARLFHTDRQVVYIRAAKIGMHEVGHLLGIEHCREAGCLMGFSRQLDQLDRLSLGFCSACAFEIRRRISPLN